MLYASAPRPGHLCGDRRSGTRTAPAKPGRGLDSARAIWTTQTAHGGRSAGGCYRVNRTYPSDKEVEGRLVAETCGAVEHLLARLELMLPGRPLLAENQLVDRLGLGLEPLEVNAGVEPLVERP